MSWNTNWFGKLGIAAIVIGLSAGTTHASYIAASYALGESDTIPVLAAPGGSGNPTTVDDSGNGFDLARTGAPLYSSNVPSGIGSTLSMAFTAANSDQYSLPNPITSANKNVAIEAWAFPTDITSSGYVVLNGDGATGYGIYKAGNTWSFIEENLGFNFAGPVVANQWVHLKLVLDLDGKLSGYVNDTLTVTQATPYPYTPINLFMIGSAFNGNIDQVAVFVPEPAAAGLLLVGASACVSSSRRRR